MKSMTAVRVLIAEEDSLTAGELRDRLEHMGVTVTAVVNSGEDAIARAEETVPDLALIDIRLKGEVGGIAAAATLRERLGIPTIYLAASSDGDAVERSKYTSPVGYLTNPLAEEELQNLLKLALRHSGRDVQQQGGSLSVSLQAATAGAATQLRGFAPSRSSPSSSRDGSEAGTISPIEPALSTQAIQAQLQKILSSRTLVQSRRLVRFLSFIVDKGLKGEETELNEYLIGVEAYQRPSSFDPQIDTIVRSEARRLRLKLDQYYTTEGIADPILIEVPKGSYAPVFRVRERAVLDKNPGQLVSHYRLLEKLGEGGMGTIYLAEDSRLNRQVALKFIHTSRLKDKHAKERLFREARIAAAIDHPNVAAIYEISEVEHQPFIAMAYVKGQDLADRMAEGPIEIGEALDIACQLAAGLEAAHRQGVVHCDLSPANVIVSDDGRARIIDFGVARLSSATRMSEPTVMGTANYLSPEQMRGEAVDQRTDIWSLGVILYEMLSGKRPFEADHREAVYYAIASKIPEPMGRWRAGITEELESIVFKCLEKEPASRYQDAATLKTDLSSARSEGVRSQDRLTATSTFPSEDDLWVEPRPETPAAPKEEPPSLVALPGGGRRFPGRYAVWIAGVTLAALLVWVGSNWWFRTARQQERGQASATAIASLPRLVVLPFESRTPGEENQALSYAISDSLITGLARLRGLQVTSWTTVMRLTERKATLPEIAKILNVQYALEGSLLRSGARGYLTAQLIRMSDDTHIWADEFDFPWKDFVAVREKVSESVVRQMKIQIQPEERHLLAQSSTQSASAYQARARGRYSLVRFSYLREPSYLIEAEKHFKRALEEDPKYADALADLAYIQFQRFYPPQGDRKDLATQGIAYAERALAINPNHVVALYVLGSLYDHIGRAEKGLELCQKAVQLGPNDPEAHHHLAWRYFQRGFYESGIEENSVAIAKDSLFLDSYHYQAVFLTHLRRYDAALAIVNRLEEAEPSSAFPRLLRATIAYSQGDLARAESGWRQVLEADTKVPESASITRVLLALISARQGRIEEARQALNRFDKKPSRANDYPIKLAVLVGEKDLAIDLIRDNQLYRNYRWLVTEPDIASLRSEPRFRELLVELYRKWRHDLATLGPSLPVPPPELPAPEEYLSGTDQVN